MTSEKKGKKQQHCTVVLFNDSILLLRKSKIPGKKYRYESMIRLEDVYRAIKSGDDDPKQGFSFKINLIQSLPNKKEATPFFVFVVATAESRDSWMSAINGAINTLPVPEPEEEITFIGERKSMQITSSIFD